MDIEDLIKGKHHRNHGHNHHDEHHHENAYGHSDHHFDEGHHNSYYKLERMRSLLNSLPHRKALLTGAIILGVVSIIVGISLLWAFLPLIAKLVGYVEANGIQGFVDALLSLAQLVWKGNG